MAGGGAVDFVVKQEQLGKFNFVQRDFYASPLKMKTNHLH